MSIHFSPEAEDDFAAAIDYLVSRNAHVAHKLSEQLFATIDKLAEQRFEADRTPVSGHSPSEITERS